MDIDSTMLDLTPIEMPFNQLEAQRIKNEVLAYIDASNPGPNTPHTVSGAVCRSL